jgi:hypothetical protein
MPQSLPELRGRFSDVAAQVNAAMSQRTWEGFQYRPSMCRATRDAHVERM